MANSLPPHQHSSHKRSQRAKHVISGDKWKGVELILPLQIFPFSNSIPGRWRRWRSPPGSPSPNEGWSRTRSSSSSASSSSRSGMTTSCRGSRAMTLAKLNWRRRRQFTLLHLHRQPWWCLRLSNPLIFLSNRPIADFTMQPRNIDRGAAVRSERYLCGCAFIK